MVHCEPQDEVAQRVDASLAPVTYLPGAGPGMKRRSPLAVETGVESGVESGTEEAAERLGLSTDIPKISGHDASEGEAFRDGGDDGDDVPHEADAAADTQNQQERAEKVLLHRLRGRSLSTAEALLVLNVTGVDSGDASEIVEKFIEMGYIDEVKLADQIIHSHNVRKGLGRKGVEVEMRRRKLDPGIMMDKLEELPDDEAERAIELASKRILQMERFDDQTIDRRLTGFLMRKGYGSAAVRLAVRAAMDGRGGSATSRVRFR